MKIEKRGRRVKMREVIKTSKDDVAKHIGTQGCPGCSAIKRNMALQPHTQECRSRFEEILKEDAK
eukprot:7296802-Karenia_brevis.AAC.1